MPKGILFDAAREAQPGKAAEVGSHYLGLTLSARLALPGQGTESPAAGRPVAPGEGFMGVGARGSCAPAEVPA